MLAWDGDTPAAFTSILMGPYSCAVFTAFTIDSREPMSILITTASKPALVSVVSVSFAFSGRLVAITIFLP